MATGKFTHTIAQIDTAIDSINSIAAKIGVTAIKPITKDAYESLSVKESNTLYVVYSESSFTIFYGALPLSSTGGVFAGSLVAALSGGAGSAGSLTEPEAV